MVILNYPTDLAEKVDELLLTNNIEVSKVKVSICVNIEEPLDQEIIQAFRKLGVFVMHPQN